MEDKINVLKQIKEDIMAQLNKQNELGVRTSRLVSVVPYNLFPITVPKSSQEIAITLENVYVAITERIIDEFGNTKKTFLIYDNTAQEIAKSEEDSKLKLDRDILDKIIDEQVRNIEKLGLTAAGIDSLNPEGSIDTYLEMLNGRMIVINDSQKQQLENVNSDEERAKKLIDFSNKNMSPQEDKETQIVIQQDEAKRCLKQDLGVEVQGVTLIDDDLFYDNNPQVKTRYAFAVLTKDGKVQIVANTNGRYEQVPGFEKSSNEAGRTSIIRNDDTQLETKNTYGSISPSTNPQNVRYTVELGPYGEVKFIEQIRNQGEVMEDSDMWLSREVNTHNTDWHDRNLAGNTDQNITRRSFDMHSTNGDGTLDTGVNGKINKINQTGPNPEITMKLLAQDTNLAVEEAFKNIKSILEQKGVELSAEDEDLIKADLKNQIERTDIVFDNETVKQYCEEYIYRKESEKKAEQGAKEPQEQTGRSRLEEALERMKKKK